MTWGKRKDGQAYNKDKPKGISGSKMDTSPTSDVHMKTSDQKEKMDFHLYRIFQYESDEGNSDRQEVAHVKAKNMEDAIKFVKDYYFKKEFHNKLNVDNSGDTAIVDSSIAYDANGNEMKEVPDGMEDDVNWTTQGFQIEEADGEEEDFKTIYGGNDFFDVTGGKIKTKGTTTAEQIKNSGSVEKAFYSHSGQGFESGNPKNSFNLNNPHPKLWKDEKK